MSTQDKRPPEKAHEELSRLVTNLQETQQRIFDLTGGEVDAVMSPGGDTLLLPHAQDDLRRVEASQRRFAATLQGILDSLPAHIALLEPDGTITMVNAAWRHFAGSGGIEAADAHIGANYIEVCEAARGDCSEEAQEAAEGIRKVLSGELPEFALEYPCHAPDRQQWFRLMVSPMRDGYALGAVAMHVDITERKLAESRLIEQAALIDQASDAIIVCDLDSRVLSWNLGAQHIYGWSEEEVVGSFVADFLYDDNDPFELAREAVLSEGAWSGELLQRTKGGEWVTIFGRWTLLRDNAGGPKSILAINTNVTDRKKLEEQFLRAQRMESIGTLAGGIAHDLNNVLAPILMSVDILQDEIDSEDGRALLAVLRDSAQRGADLIKQVLAFARGVEGNRVNLNPMLIIREVQKIAVETFPKGIDFHLRAPDDLWMVHAEPTQLHQILMNLCVNARDAMPNGGRLTVELNNIVVDDVFSGMNIDAVSGPYVIIEVQDTGTGIDREVQGKMFEPFFTTKELGKGTGLGLSTTFTIVREHGGFINVYSELGKGATFKVYLPAVTEPSSAELAALEQAELPRGDGELVLLVDDEESIRTVTKKALERFGYRVMVARHGAEAVSLFVQHRDEIAIVLTDMSMPVMDGPTMIVALKSIDPSVRIIGSSGMNSDGNVAKALAAGVEFFVPKPYTAETLLRMLKQVLADYGGGELPSPVPMGKPGAVAGESGSVGAAGGETVLVVDDESTMRELAARILAKAGYTVLEAESGQAALEALEGHGGEVRIMLTDLGMEGMTGSELIAEVAGRHPGIRVIIMTGDISMARLEAGAHGVLAKPFTVEQLRKTVREVLNG